MNALIVWTNTQTQVKKYSANEKLLILFDGTVLSIYILYNKDKKKNKCQIFFMWNSFTPKNKKKMFIIPHHIHELN